MVSPTAVLSKDAAQLVEKLVQTYKTFTKFDVDFQPSFRNNTTAMKGLSSSTMKGLSSLMTKPLQDYTSHSKSYCKVTVTM